MANTNRDIINSAMGLSQDPNYDDIQATMGGSQPGSGGGGPGAPLTITGTPPSDGRVGDSYTFAPQTAGGSGTRTYSLAGGSLLSGLMLSTATGAITGTPTVDGIISGLSVRVSDATGSAATVPGNVTIAVAGGGVVLEPNPGGGTTEVAGPINSLAATDTASGVNFIEARLSGTTIAKATAYAGLLADGTGYRGMQIADATHYAGATRNADGSDNGGPIPAFASFADGQAPVLGDKIRVDRTVNKIVHSVIKPDGTTYETFSEDAAEGSIYFGTWVALAAANNVAYTDVVYGGAAVPLRVDSQVLTAGYKPQARLLYTGNPGAAGYQCRIRSAGGSVLVDWADAVLTDAVKGGVTATSTAGVPVSEFGQNVRIDWRQKNLPAVVQTRLEAMPAGKAQIGMNLTGAGHTSSERIFKNLLIANDGWRDGGSTIKIEEHPELFSADGDLISKGSFNSAKQAFGRGNVSGTRFRAEWEGGDNPLTDMVLAGGQGVSYSNVNAGSRFIEFDYNFSWNTIGSFGYIEQKGFYPSNPVRNIRISEVGTDYTTGVFDDTFIARASVYDYVRLMDWMGSNAANYISSTEPWLLEWTNRTLPGKNLFGYTGFPLEYVIEFANRSGCDIWIMTPAGASPDYQKKIIRALFYGEGMLAFGSTPAGCALNNTVIVYDELGNEWFNSQFSIWQSAKDAGYAFGRGGSGNNETRINEMIYRLKTHWTAIEGQFPAGRLKKMCMGNPSDTYDIENIHLQGGDAYDIYGCAFYTMNVKFEDQPNLWPGQNLQALFDFANASIPPQLVTLKSQRDFATSKGKGFWVYEGNPSHWLELRGTMPYADQAFFTSFQQDARMEDTTTRWFDAFTSNIAGGLTCYAAFGEPSAIYGSWGFTANQGDTTLAKSPKQRALLSAVQRLNA